MEYNYVTNNENDFTKSKKNDTIKSENKSQDTGYPMLNETQKSNIASAKHARDSGIISEAEYQANLKKNGVTTKKEDSDFSLVKPPKEKLEMERLRKVAGEYNLNKVSPQKLDDGMRLKKKTPDDYYRSAPDLKEEKKRLDEVFGAKTDFSISNFENNYDKFNQEEKEMITHKMQLEFNNRGYTDKDGFKLKTDGIFGNKTKGVYEQYKKDNKEDYDDAMLIKKRAASENQPAISALKGTPQTNVVSLANEPPTPILYSMQNEEVKKSISSNTENHYQKANPEIYYSYEEFDYPEEVKPKAENPKIIEKADKVIKDNAEYIKNAAKKFGVNPGILGTCIYAEQVLNVNITDSLLDVFAGKRGKNTSIGISQVLLSTAKELEDKGYMPKIQSSNDGSLASFLGADINLQRVKALEDPETNIMYAAAYLKYIQDTWKKEYPEIDGRTVILATLYNIGVRGSKGPHANPKPNDFGRFARNNYFRINRLLGI